MSYPSNSKPVLRKTRIVCISDTHSASPADGGFKLPKGDVLIHAGDLTNQGSLSEIKRAVKWIEEADFEVKIVIAGNHDLSLDESYTSNSGLSISPDLHQTAPTCRSLLRSSLSITYLEHSSATIRLTSPTGPNTTFTVFGSPYIPACGNWAFQYDASSPRAKQLWAAIPLDSDVVVTHSPAWNHLDASPKWGAAGCPELRKALWRVRPRLAVCGHVHEARGAERVRWKLDLARCPFLEQGTKTWVDRGRGNKKMSLVDLTAAGGDHLDNDGAGVRVGFSNVVEFSNDGTAEEKDWLGLDEEEMIGKDCENEVVIAETAGQNDDRYDGADDSIFNHSARNLSRLHQDNIRAIWGRTERKETCFVNAAIMARSYGKGPKVFNKPIIIDIDLPVWIEEVVG